VVFQLIEGAFQVDVADAYVVGRHLQKVEEALRLACVRGRAVLVEAFQFQDQVAQEMSPQGEAVAHCLFAAGDDLFHAFAGEEAQGFEAGEDLQLVHARIGQQVMQECVGEEAQGAGDRVRGGQARAAGAPGFDGEAFGPIRLNLSAFRDRFPLRELGCYHEEHAAHEGKSP
jgi:hypothetical protein